MKPEHTELVNQYARAEQVLSEHPCIESAQLEGRLEFNLRISGSQRGRENDRGQAAAGADSPQRGQRQAIENANGQMTVRITYFVHGTTTDNEKGISSGWFDVGLSDLGVQQSTDLKDQMKDRKFDVVFCSDLKRAMDSAKLSFEGIVQIIPDARLRECNYGTYNAQASVVVEPMQEVCITKKFPEGESYEDVKNRVADFLEFLKLNYDGKIVAIVAHKAPQLALDVLLRDKTWEQAFAEDWRKRKAWQPGWDYTLG